MIPLPSLIGQWTLDREITSVDGITTFSGIAGFASLQKETLHYRENGMLTLPQGSILPAFRTYIFRLNKTGFSVFFDETPPRLFHDVMLAPVGDALLCRVSHFCAPDLYLSTYSFFRDGSFHIVHDVAGPAKSYVSTTRYTRLR